VTSSRGEAVEESGTEGVATQSVKVAAPAPRVPRGVYEQELYRLQAELVKIQEWVRRWAAG
jgi:hypothetical protein